MRQLEGMRVLVVEDDADVRHLMRLWIESTGAAVSEAEEGAQALAVARLERPHAVLCDLKMPGKDGFAFMAELKREPDLRHTPVFVVSGEIDAAQVRRTWEAGFSGHLVKPVTRDAIVSQLARVFRSA